MIYFWCSDPRSERDNESEGVLEKHVQINPQCSRGDTSQELLRLCF